ncbi:DUF4937 domain-containing protein, partial [Parageobacillus thermoglucosidasius]
QIGGWNAAKPQEAWILAFWENLDFYQSFMSDKHDEILERSKQTGTYQNISVDIVEVKQPAEWYHMNMIEALQNSKMLYVISPNRLREKRLFSDTIKHGKHILATFRSAHQLAVLCASMEFHPSEWKNMPHTQVKLESAWTVV